jgi:AraC-like DNA-binding protein
MPRPPVSPRDFAVWRVGGLQDLELQRAERAATRRTPHVHGEFEIAIIERGAQRIRRRGTTTVAGEGTIVVIPPGEVHAHEPLEGTDAASRSFFPDLAALSEASSVATPSFRDLVMHDAGLGRYIGALHRMLETPGSALARETHAVFAATTLVQRHGSGGSTEAPTPECDRIIKRVREYLHDRLDANVSLSELSELTGLPPTRLVRAFQHGIGMAPHAYHVQIRVNRAKQLLASGQGVAAVAGATGFVDQSHLTRHFRRCVGVTPGMYATAVRP